LARQIHIPNLEFWGVLRCNEKLKYS